MRLFLYCLLLLFATGSHAQIVINEVCTKNSTVITDDFGNTSDWIELYNPSGETVDLSGYSLSDDPNLPQKWTIDKASIGPGEFLMVYASEKDIRTTTSSSSRSDLTGLGYVYADETDAGTPGNSTVEYLDYEDAFFGTDPAMSCRINLVDNTGGLGYSYAGIFTKFGQWNATVDRSDYRWLKVKAQITENRKIDVRVQQKGVNSWEGYIYSITGSGADSTYEIPLFGDTGPLDLTVLEGIDFAAAYPYGTTDFRVYEIDFFNKEGYLHTNFKLSGDGESLFLSNASGEVESYLYCPSLNSDHSFGKTPDGSNTNLVFTTPTPGKPNSETTEAGIYCDKKINFSVTAGLYDTPQTITLSGASEIRYTLDGSDPNKASLLYTQPIEISGTTVLKATCTEEETIVKDIYTNTYIINHATKLPVFSLSTAPDHLFGHTNGILADGPGWTPEPPNFGANFWKDWERPVHVEFFDQNGVRQIDQDAGIKVFGGWSRTHEQKSLRLKAKKQYGAERFEYKFFPEKNIESFRQIVLRNSGNEFNMTQLHDGFVQTLAQGTNVDYLGYRPSIVFINGEFWGIMNIREKINDHYLDDNHGIASDNIDMAEAWGQVLYGKNNLNEMAALAESSNLAGEENFKLVADSFDLKNMVDYFAMNIFISNWDWPQNNLKFWRPKTGKRKYRYIMYDTDISLGKWALQLPQFNQLKRVLEPQSADNNYNSPHGKIFKALLSNASFKNDFVNRYADLMNTIFTKEHFDSELARLKDSISYDISAHHERWGEDYDWNYRIFQDLRDFRGERIVYARQELENYFNLNGQVNLTIDVEPAGAGEIRISTITPDAYPWTGVYFDGVPVSLQVIPNPGYSFDHWESSNGFISNNDAAQLINFTSNDRITAHFKGSSSTTTITVSEINYNSEDLGSIDPDDWLEVWNYGTHPVDLSYWQIKDSKDYNKYEFPFGSVLGPNERVVIAKNPEALKKLHNSLEVLGKFDFSLSNGGEQIRVFDKKGNLFQEILYDDKAPWPAEPDGGGYTLELTGTTGDFSEPFSWSYGCHGGSPLFSPDTPCDKIVFGFEKGKNESLLQIYPNPTYGQLNIVLPPDLKNGVVQVLTIQGEKVHNEPFSSQNRTINLDLSKLESGIYMAVINSDSNTYSEKIIVK